MDEFQYPFRNPILPGDLWEKDADYSIPVISMVGQGPKGDQGEKGDSASPADIVFGIERWLTEHPEAVTTLLDGSVTMSKLAEDVISAMAAELAEQQADDAAQAALEAQKSANAALYQLSVIEDVVGTLNWISQHATYHSTEDDVIAPGKTYYEYNSAAGVYKQVNPPEVSYVETADTEPGTNKDYYILDPNGVYIEASIDEGFEPDVTYYERVVTNPSSLGLYEADVADYITSHVTVNDDGMLLSANDGDFRMQLSTGGWEVLDKDGQPVTATIADENGHVTSTIGKLDKLHLSISESRLAFSYPNGNKMIDVAWIDVDPETGRSSFHIENAVVMRELRIGHWKWYENAGTYLVLKWFDDAE